VNTLFSLKERRGEQRIFNPGNNLTLLRGHISPQGLNFYPGDEIKNRPLVVYIGMFHCIKNIIQQIIAFLKLYICTKIFHVTTDACLPSA
jgi:hypothetical protein